MPESQDPTPEFLAQLRIARRAESADRAAGRRALSAVFDRSAGRVMVELSNGAVFGFLPSHIPTLAHLTDAQLTEVTVTPGGSGLEWEALDIQVSVAGIILDALDPQAARSALARIAGKSRSSAKAAAARANGKKGGRPRTKAAPELASPHRQRHPQRHQRRPER